jgi:phosphatidylinositol alpha-mannosyltransferase
LTAVLVKLAPIVATFHSAGESGAYKTFQKLGRPIARRIDVRVAVSADAVELAQRYIGGEYEVLFNGIDLEAYSGPIVEQRDNAIFFCGRHEPRKGLGVLLEAVSLMPGDVRLWIASDGPETESLKAQYENDQRIEWLGRISDAEKIDRLRRASLFCAPSLRGESFGIVLLEAMAAGTPVVSTDIDGYRNVATDGENALLVEAGNAHALASAMSRIIADPRLATRLTAAGRIHAQSYSLDALADHYVLLYEKALGMEADDITKIELPRMLKRFEGRFLRRNRLGGSGQ